VRAEGDEKMPTIEQLEFAIEQMNNIETTDGNHDVIQLRAEHHFDNLRGRGSQSTACYFTGTHRNCIYGWSGNWISIEAMKAIDANDDQRIRCMVCNNQNRMGKYNKGGWGICYSCVPKYIPRTYADLPASLKKLKSQLTKKKRDYRKAVDKSQPYIEAGLGPAFALAIAKGTPDGEVMDLWEADWWKQYDDEDMLIVAVLDGTLTEEQGRYLNGIRSDHERLALTCVENPDMIAWADALLECGFNKVPDAVNNVLDGGQPHIVARIRKMKINAEITPEPLKKPVYLQNPPEHMLEKEDDDDEDKNPMEEEYREHVEEMADELEA
tara:strand:+ start:575 stop:1549 length:975 start_codon:yes stop_codon:yes gene_type:complete